MKLVERVATVIGAAIYKPQPDMSGKMSNALSPRQWRSCMDAAQEAIRAMRDPSEELIVRALKTHAIVSRDSYHAIIDAAIEEGEE